MVKLERTLVEVVRENMKKCNLFEDLALNRLEWGNKIQLIYTIIVGIKLDNDDDDI